MKLSQTSLAIIAGAGLLSLATSTRAEDPKPAAPPHAHHDVIQNVVDEQLKNLTEKLKLTTEQQPKVKAMLETRDKAMQSMMELSPEERTVKMQLLHEADVKKMKKVLTADQFKQYEELSKKNHGVHPSAEKKAPAPAESPVKK